MYKKLKFILLLLSFACIMISFQNCSGKKKNTKNDTHNDKNRKKSDLKIYYSTNLNNSIEEVIKEFNKAYPGINVTKESGTAMQTIKKITKQNEFCDIVILSDYNQLDRFLIPDITNWSIAFAGNEMVIAYTDKSRMSKEITSKNWYKILLDKNIKFGRADKDSDICGIRTVLTIKLAEMYYKEKGLSEKFANKDKRYIMPKPAGLLPLLVSNDIDYLITFKSFAVIHKLKYITLPVEINFRSLDNLSDYGKVSFEKKGKNKAKTHGILGTPMLYGMTIPFNAQNIENAMKFAEFLIKPDKGLAIFEKMGNNIWSPIPTTHFGTIPEPLKKYVSNYEAREEELKHPMKKPEPKPPK